MGLGSTSPLLLAFLQHQINILVYQQQSQYNQLLAKIIQLANLQQSQFDVLNGKISGLHDQYMITHTTHITSPKPTHPIFQPIIHQSTQINQAVVIVGGCLGACSTIDTEIFNGGKFL